MEYKLSWGFFGVVFGMAKEELLRSAWPGHHGLWIASREAAALEVTADMWVPDSHLAVTCVPEGGFVTQGSSKGLLLGLEEKSWKKKTSLVGLRAWLCHRPLI